MPQQPGTPPDPRKPGPLPPSQPPPVDAAVPVEQPSDEDS